LRLSRGVCRREPAQAPGMAQAIRGTHRNRRRRRFAFLGTLGEKSGLHTFGKFRQFSDALCSRYRLIPNGMEAMRMIAHLDSSEDACFAVFYRGALEYRAARTAGPRQRTGHLDPYEHACFRVLCRAALEYRVPPMAGPRQRA